MAVVTMPEVTDQLKAIWKTFQNQLKAQGNLPEDVELGIVIFLEGGPGDPVRVAELEAQVAALTAERDATVERNSELEDQVAALASAGATAVERIAELEAQILTLTAERDGAIQRIARLEEWIDAVPQSLEL